MSREIGDKIGFFFGVFDDFCCIFGISFRLFSMIPLWYMLGRLLRIWNGSFLIFMHVIVFRLRSLNPPWKLNLRKRMPLLVGWGELLANVWNSIFNTFHDILKAFEIFTCIKVIIQVRFCINKWSNLHPFWAR